MFHAFVNKRTFHLLRVSLDEAAALSTEDEEPEAAVEDIQDGVSFTM